ncbi:MAG: PAS domain-containing protein [Phycisphaerae bacterium]|nr:PAS domain-containing protein [Gemmatimonadaceae bacterium]
MDELCDAFFAVDSAWRFTFVNAQASRSWQRSPESLLGRVMWEEFPTLIGSDFEAAYRRAATERVPVVLNSNARGDTRWYELRIFPSGDGLVACYRDTTEMKQTEAALRRVSAESERERRTYHTILSAAADMHYVLDTSGRFLFATEALLRLWNRRDDEIIGRTLLEIDQPPAIANRFADQVAQVVERRVSVRDEMLFAGDTGGRTFEYILTPVLNAEGDVEAVTGAARDTTARRANELTLLEEARRKDEFIATLAHELRNPLAPIRNALEVARLAKGNDVAIEYAHGVMERQMSHMVRLIDDLLDLSRLNLGKVTLKLAPVEVGSILESAIETARPHIEHAGHSLELSLPDEELCIDADATRLMQVFANLLNNAAKFTAQSGRVWVTAAQADDYAVISVRDNGIGMSQSMLSQVFEMFRQEADPLNRTEGGLGIGLTLVKGLVQLHGGTVHAVSEGKGLGSEFIVRLPLTRTFHEPVLRGSRVPNIPATNWHRILVVDDNADSATSMSMMLNFLGHDTRTANDGIRGLELAEQFKPGVCLLDIGMPNLNGFEMAQRIRAEPWGKNILLIAISGWGQEHDQERSRDAGFDMHFVKPIDPATLTSVLSAPRK